MKIDRLLLKNFKGFETKEFSFHPEFNLISAETAAAKPVPSTH